MTDKADPVLERLEAAEGALRTMQREIVGISVALGILRKARKRGGQDRMAIVLSLAETAILPACARFIEASQRVQVVMPEAMAMLARGE
jgi:hypothetical protein